MDVAAQYDEERSNEKKWSAELTIISKIVAKIEPDASILDVPLGTGRFLSLYGQDARHALVGADISMDMLLQARRKIERQPGENRTWTIVGDAEQLPLKHHSIDYVVCIRFLNWLSGAHFDQVLTECRRVARRGLVFGIRVHCELRPYNLIQLRGPQIKPALYHLLGSVRIALARRIRSLGKIEQESLDSEIHSYDNESNEFKLHDDSHTRSLFAKMGLKISQQFTLDVRWDANTKRILPYRIFFLKFQ